jgi:hypothetical protein
MTTNPRPVRGKLPPATPRDIPHFGIVATFVDWLYDDVSAPEPASVTREQLLAHYAAALRDAGRKGQEPAAPSPRSSASPLTPGREPDAAPDPSSQRPGTREC